MVHSSSGRRSVPAIRGELIDARQRDVLFTLCRFEFRARYRAQALGVAWSLLSPLLMVGLLVAVFGTSMGLPRSEYLVFALIGQVSWQFVSRAWSTTTHAFLAHRQVAKRSSVARWMLPTSITLSWLPNLALELSLLMVVGLFDHAAFHFGLTWFLLPVVLVCLVALVLGLGLLSSILFVYFRDVAYLVDTLLIFGYWLTPIVYTPEFLSPRVRALVALNPLAMLLGALRGILMKDELPSLHSAVLALATVGAIFASGVVATRRGAPHISDRV
jgi:ABC-type polysaccharide/polyol phosphate export permease